MEPQHETSGFVCLFVFTPFSPQTFETFWVWHSHLNNLLSSAFGELQLNCETVPQLYVLTFLRVI